nr:unnamed protein product [Callosobruchus chinensis]
MPLTKLNVNDLMSSELAYEIKIRGLEVPSAMDDKRKVLRGLLSQEQHGRNFSESSFSSGYDSSEHRRICTRLLHLSNRIDRLAPTSEEEITQKSRFKTQLVIAESDLLAKLQLPTGHSSPAPMPVTFNPTQPMQTQPVTTVAAPLPPLAMNPQPFSPVSFTQQKKIPIFKWGIRKFNGKTSLIEFLELVQSLMASRGCNEMDLYAAAGDLFEGIAWTWWHNGFVRGAFHDWGDLVRQLKDAFLRDNYDINLIDEILRRKQGQREPVITFIAFMESQFNRLTSNPFTEKDMVNIIRRNFLPDYVKSSALYDILTLGQLTSFCRKLEDSFLTCQPGNRSDSSLGNDAYSPAPRKPIVCWNCEKLGHSSQQCRSPRIKFCYDCGMRNVTKSTCPSCSKNVLRHEVPALTPGPSHVQNKGVTFSDPNMKGKSTPDIDNSEPQVTSNLGSKNFVEPLIVSKANDNRPYLSVCIDNENITALLDSGSNANILGSSGLYLLRKLNLNIDYNTALQLTTADGQIQNTLGFFYLPITFNGEGCKIKVLVVPSISHQLILGIDFILQFKLNINFGNFSYQSCAYVLIMKISQLYLIVAAMPISLGHLTLFIKKTKSQH